MSNNSKISARGTFIFDEKDLEEIDKYSLTTVLGEFTESLNEPLASHADDVAADEHHPAEVGSALPSLSDATINSLLDDFQPVDPVVASGTDEPASTHGTNEASEGDLLDPGILFPGMSIGESVDGD